MNPRRTMARNWNQTEKEKRRYERMAAWGMIGAGVAAIGVLVVGYQSLKTGRSQIIELWKAMSRNDGK